MKQEPEWVDVVAMFAMLALLSRPKSAQPEEKDRRDKKV